MKKIHKIISILLNYPPTSWIRRLSQVNQEHIIVLNEFLRDNVLDVYYQAEAKQYVRTCSVSDMLMSLTYLENTLVVERLDIFSLSSDLYLLANKYSFLKLIK